MATGNIIATEGKKIALNRTFKVTPDYTAPTVFKIGTDNTTPAITDTDLINAVPISDEETVDDCDAVTGWTDSADMTVSVNTDTFRLGIGALNLTKDGGTSTDANTQKTTTSLDFTSKRLEFFLYINTQPTLDLLATTDCLTIRFGSDSSNYRQWTRDKSQLSVGWNYINNMTAANADSTTGSPVDTASDFTFIQLTTTLAASTWAVGEAIMDDIRLADDGDFTKVFITGYPTFDETNLQVTIRTFLNSLEANGHDLVETGIFNTDVAPKMWSRSVFTSVSKTDTIEVTFVQKDKIT